MADVREPKERGFIGWGLAILIAIPWSVIVFWAINI
jgi:hypothetical protein